MSDLLVTEFQKGRAKFEKMFVNDVINPKGFTQSISEDLVKEILSTGESTALNDLDAIGEHFKKSWRTRPTGHKNNDFYLLQTNSSMNIQKLYSDIMTIQENTSNTSEKDSKHMIPFTSALDGTFGDTMKSYDKKIKKAAKELISLVSVNKQMKKQMEEKLKELKQNGKIGECQKYVDEFLGSLSDDVEFVTAESTRITDEAKKVAGMLGCTGGLTAAYTPMVATGGTYAILCAGLFASLAAPTFSAMEAIINSAIVAAVGVGIGTLGVGIGFAAIVLIAALALWCANELGVTKRLATIGTKVFVARVKSKMRDIIKYENDAVRFANKYLKDKNAHKGFSTEITDDIKKIVKGFVGKQKALWLPYTTAAGRDYFDEFKRSHGKHWSGIRKVLDNKESTEIGAAKLGLANVWTKMVVVL